MGAFLVCGAPAINPGAGDRAPALRCARRAVDSPASTRPREEPTMPSTHLLDFEKLDLSRSVATHAEIYSVIKQRGRFALLDGVLHFDRASELVVGFKDIRADDWWAPDHIPGRPIFPGALMIESAAQLCSWDFMKRGTHPNETFVGFGGLDGTRFRGIVEPGHRMIFAGTVKRSRSRMFTYVAQGFVERELVFETEVIGVIV
jgi:3-hydroxyacyl-[acyl-carrier-protein] dehydratase